jgi:hypothetical protein
VVIVVERRARLSVSRLVDRRRIGTIIRSGRDSRRIGAIGWSMYRMHIGTIIVCVGSSTVPATGSFGWQCNASNGVVFVGVLARILVFVRRRIGTAVVSFVGHGRLGRT